MRRRNARPRAVVDTNLIISGLISSLGLPRQLLMAWRRRQFVLVITAELLLEYGRVLARPQFARECGITEEQREAFLRRLRTAAVRVRPGRTLPVSIRDPKDTMVLAAAVGGKADYIVTGDADLLDLADHPRLESLRIVTARTFLATLEAI